MLNLKHILVLSLMATAGCEQIGLTTPAWMVNGLPKQKSDKPLDLGVGYINTQNPDAKLNAGDVNSFAAIGNTVLFSSGSAKLTSKAISRLNKQAEWLKSNTDYAAVIMGYADERGSRSYNMTLAANRSKAVRNYLLGRGVPGYNLKAGTHGEEYPKGGCVSCLPENRRAVTYLVKADQL